jgi:hypothetical protein
MEQNTLETIEKQGKEDAAIRNLFGLKSKQKV